MASATVVRTILGASLALGAVDLLWIDLELAPAVLAREEAPVSVAVPVPVPVPVSEAEPETEPEPEPETAPVPAPPTLEHVYFATRSTDLDATARTTLDGVADTAGGQLVLIGHADIRGRERLNEALSRDRARAVADYLIERGVAPDRIEVRYVGEDDAAPAGALWRDRRVDISATGGPP